MEFLVDRVQSSEFRRKDVQFENYPAAFLRRKLWYHLFVLDALIPCGSWLFPFIGSDLITRRRRKEILLHWLILRVNKHNVFIIKLNLILIDMSSLILGCLWLFHFRSLRKSEIMLSRRIDNCLLQWNGFSLFAVECYVRIWIYDEAVDVHSGDRVLHLWRFWRILT